MMAACCKRIDADAWLGWTSCGMPHMPRTLRSPLARSPTPPHRMMMNVAI